jgi:hypothetical protein
MLNPRLTECSEVVRHEQKVVRDGGLMGLGCSGWLDDYGTFWVDPGMDWDEGKVAEVLELWR